MIGAEVRHSPAGPAVSSERWRVSVSSPCPNAPTAPAAAAGIAILLISSDLPEVLAMSDRILVMREGRQMALLDRADATQERVLTAAMGQHNPAATGKEAGVTA